MGFYETQVVPRFTDLVMSRRELTPIRARVAASLDGDVLEVGFGSGLNVPHYPPAVTQVRAVDPATVGRKLAAKLSVRWSWSPCVGGELAKPDAHRRHMTGERRSVARSRRGQG